MSQETDWIEPTGECHTVTPNTSTADNTGHTTGMQAERIGEAVQQLKTQIRRLHDGKKQTNYVNTFYSMEPATAQNQGNNPNRHLGVQLVVMVPNALDALAFRLELGNALVNKKIYLDWSGGGDIPTKPDKPKAPADTTMLMEKLDSTSRDDSPGSIQTHQGPGEHQKGKREALVHHIHQEDSKPEIYPGPKWAKGVLRQHKSRPEQHQPPGAIGSQNRSGRAYKLNRSGYQRNIRPQQTGTSTGLQQLSLVSISLAFGLISSTATFKRKLTRVGELGNMMVTRLEEEWKTNSEARKASMEEFQTFWVKQLTDILSTKKHKVQAHYTEEIQEELGSVQNGIAYHISNQRDMVRAFNASVMEPENPPLTSVESGPPEWARALSAQVAALQATVHAKAGNGSGWGPPVGKTLEAMKILLLPVWGEPVSPHVTIPPEDMTKVIDKGYYLLWPGLNKQRVEYYLDNSMYTIKGHLSLDLAAEKYTKQPRTNKWSVTAGVISTSELRTAMGEPGTISLELVKGQNYIYLMFDYDTNYIMTVPIKSREAEDLVEGFRTCYEELKEQGMDHFVSILFRVNKDCCADQWGLLVPQVIMTLNFLLSSRINGDILVYNQVKGAFNFMKTPLAPLGCKVIVYNQVHSRGAWEEQGNEGFYIGPAMKHYRNYRCPVKTTGAVRVSNTVELLSKHCEMPITSSTDKLTMILLDLKDTMQKPRPPEPFLKYWSEITTAPGIIKYIPEPTKNLSQLQNYIRGIIRKQFNDSKKDEGTIISQDLVSGFYWAT
eukprot:jgi/Psemu1/2825/gm1.2825_g